MFIVRVIIYIVQHALFAIVRNLPRVRSFSKKQMCSWRVTWSAKRFHARINYLPVVRIHGVSSVGQVYATFRKPCADVAPRTTPPPSLPSSGSVAIPHHGDELAKTPCSRVWMHLADSKFARLRAARLDVHNELRENPICTETDGFSNCLLRVARIRYRVPAYTASNRERHACSWFEDLRERHALLEHRQKTSVDATRDNVA